MKRLIILATIILAAAVTSLAQEGLDINSLFDGRFRTVDSAQETIISGGDLEAYDIDLYHSLTLRAMPDAAAVIEPLVTRDGARAADREVSFRDGALYYGFYTLPKRKGVNRYIIYLNQHPAGGDKIILLYLEGKASAATVRKLISQ